MPWDDGLSPEQRDIITDDARIKVVRAGPGSGKTTLFVAAIQHALDNWESPTTGIAALSYTNIAQQEIEKKAGAIPAPHLIATIDAFILRFIIRPFASIIAGHPDGIRLLPAPVAQHYDTDIQIGATHRDRAKLTLAQRPLDDATINRRLPNGDALNAPRPAPPVAAPVAWHTGTRLDTIHGVKGEEFDLVALYCPQPANRGQQRCISTQWWNPQQDEERRVAYVATTRAKRIFILCVHQTTYEALRLSQPGFFEAFAPPQQ